MAGLDADTQNRYALILQNALETAWQAALGITDGVHGSMQRRILVDALATARSYAPMLNPDVKAETRPMIGHTMPDGTLYAGLSPTTGKAMYATPNDAPLTYTFNKAQKYAAKLDAYGHRDWRVPTKGELNVLFQNRAAIGGFNVSGSVPAGWYWSSSHIVNDNAWAQRFSDGAQNYFSGHDCSSLRCVR